MVCDFTRNTGLTALTSCIIKVLYISLFKCPQNLARQTFQIALMRVFPKAIVLNTRPRFGLGRTYCINVRLGGGHNNLRINLHKCYLTKQLSTVIPNDVFLTT